MRNQLLRDADWAGMAHSLEIRVPLVDIVLLKAMAAHIPALAAGGGKAMLANAPHTPLPGEILDTPKTGFQIPAAKWLSGAKASGERTASRKSVPAILSTWLETLETVPQLRAA
jgi:asparagine synthase (glutamine-hydrolysing)